jgi:hypothetical protein
MPGQQTPSNDPSYTAPIPKPASAYCKD